MEKELIADIRQFNRFYTNVLGLLDQHVLDTAYSFTESRVLVEIGLLDECIANQLVERLVIDRSYMSRIIKKFVRDGLLIKIPSTTDSRTSLLRLTEQGQALFQELNKKSDEQIVRLFHNLSQQELQEIQASMNCIHRKLAKVGNENDDTI